MTAPTPPAPHAAAPPERSRARQRLRALIPWLAIGGVLALLPALVEVTISGPRVYVRWSAELDPAARATRERRYELRNGEPDRVSSTTWQYELGNRSRENLAALVSDPAAEDTHNIDRQALTAPRPDVRVSRRPLPSLPSIPRPFPFGRGQPLEHWRDFAQVQASAWLWLAGGAMLWAARGPASRRRMVGIGALLLVGTAMLFRPIDSSFVRMGEAEDHGRSRAEFETYFDDRVRFEKHLSQTILLQVYRGLEPTEAAPREAMRLLARGAGVWFIVCALVIGVMEAWSATVLRYLALALFAPATLLYFGWREYGYLSLNVAAFPLIARGLRDGGPRLETGSALAGLGAAFHGTGLISLAGAGLAALGTAMRLADKATRTLRLAVWGTAAYLGWILIYMTLLDLPIDPGQPRSSRWRPLFEDEVRQGRLAAAIASETGARDLSVSAWVVGGPLLLVAGALWRRYPHETRAALFYSLPSLVFVTFRWPFWGIGIGADLLVAGFPALYALAWVCAQSPKHTKVAAVLLVSAHMAFWWMTLDQQFDVRRV